MATPAVNANLKERMEELGAEVEKLRTTAANHAKELETIAARRLTCPPEEIAKLITRKDVLATLLERTNKTLAEQQAAYDAMVREIRADEKAWRDGEPLRKMGKLLEEIETDLAPMRVALNPRAWVRIQRNIFELRRMAMLNVQSTSRVNTMAGNIGEGPMQAPHAPMARQEISRIVGELMPLYSVLAGMLGR